MVNATTNGRIASFYYLHHTTMAKFSTTLSPDMPPEAILRCMCNASEYDELPVRHNEEILNAELAKHVPVPVDVGRCDDPHVKAELLLQAHLSRVALPIADYGTDTKAVLDNALRLLQAMIDMAAGCGWLGTTLAIMKLVQMIMQVCVWVLCVQGVLRGCVVVFCSVGLLCCSCFSSSCFSYKYISPPLSCPTISSYPPNTPSRNPPPLSFLTTQARWHGDDTLTMLPSVTAAHAIALRQMGYVGIAGLLKAAVGEEHGEKQGGKQQGGKQQGGKQQGGKQEDGAENIKDVMQEVCCYVLAYKLCGIGDCAHLLQQIWTQAGTHTSPPTYTHAMHTHAHSTYTRSHRYWVHREVWLHIKHSHACRLYTCMQPQHMHLQHLSPHQSPTLWMHMKKGTRLRWVRNTRGVGRGTRGAWLLRCSYSDDRCRSRWGVEDVHERGMFV